MFAAVLAAALTGQYCQPTGYGYGGYGRTYNGYGYNQGYNYNQKAYNYNQGYVDRLLFLPLATPYQAPATVTTATTSATAATPTAPAQPPAVDPTGERLDRLESAIGQLAEATAALAAAKAQPAPSPPPAPVQPGVNRTPLARAWRTTDSNGVVQRELMPDPGLGAPDGVATYDPATGKWTGLPPGMDPPPPFEAAPKPSGAAPISRAALNALKSYCYGCHGAASKGGFRIFQGDRLTLSADAIADIFDRVGRDPSDPLAMPQKKILPPDARKAILEWAGQYAEAAAR